MDKPRDGKKMGKNGLFPLYGADQANSQLVLNLCTDCWIDKDFFPCSLSAVIAWRISVVCAEFKFINTFQESWVTDKIPFSQKAKLLTGFKTRAGFFHLAKHSESLFVMAGRPGLKHNCPDSIFFLVELQGLCKKHKGLHHKGVFGALSCDKCHYLPEQLVIWQNWASLMSLLI